MGARSYWSSWGTLRRLTRLLGRQRPDVLQTFLFHANVLGPWAARRAGLDVPIVTGIRVAERQRSWHRWVARRTAHWATRHVCVSQSVADFTARATRIDPQSLMVIPNGVDVSRFEHVPATDSTSLGLAPGRRAIVFVGRLDVQKGIDALLEQLPRVFASQESHDLLLVGSGPEEPNLRRQVEKLGIGGRVHFAGRRSDVPAILAASDVLVLPSRWEGMPNVLLEAMASGKPVVAMAAEGVAEILGAESGAQLVPLGDMQVFMQKLLAVLGDPALRARFGAANRHRVAQHFALEKMVAAYADLYEELARAAR